MTRTLYRRPIAIVYNDPYPLENNKKTGESGVLDSLDAFILALKELRRPYKILRIETINAVEIIQELIAGKYDMAINLCEDISGNNLREPNIPALLELIGVEYTGSGPLALGLTCYKDRSKHLLKGAGLKTPAFFVSDQEMERTPIDFPLIVKPQHEDASIGIHHDSVVYDLERLNEKIGYIREVLKQPSIVEQYIDGREFNVGLIGNPAEVLPIAEIDFNGMPEGMAHICSYEAKWNYGSVFDVGTKPYFPELDKKLKQDITNAAVRAYELFQCRDYARVDMRVDQKGVPYILEVNCNPDISPEAGFFRAFSSNGRTYADLVAMLISFVEERIQTREPLRMVP
ncbi:MAG TPA: ATP-grasp domain-containing protein [Acidobacteriota bacterium]|nr:ATP-grasp domain-containing protein [Acidobacteriota bacterium]